MKNLFRALQFFRPDAALMALVAVLMLLSIGANLLKPWPLALLVDSLAAGARAPSRLAAWLGNWPLGWRVGVLAGSILVVHLLQGLLSSIQTFLLIKIGLRGLTRVRNCLFHWLQRLSLRYHQGANQGDLIYRASWDTYAFQTLIQHGLFTFISASLTLVIMVAVMGRMNLPLTLTALGTVPLLLLSMKGFSGRMSQRSLAANEADSRVTSLVQQGIVALPLTQSYTREAQEEQRFAAQVAESFRKRLAQHGCEVAYLAVIAIIFGLGVAAIAWVGAGEVQANRLTIGGLLIFLAYLGQFYEPLNQLSHVSAATATARAGTQRVFAILDAAEEVRDAPNARRVIRPAEQHVSHDKPGRAALDASGSTDRPHEPPNHPSQNRAPTNPLVVRGALEFDRVSFGYQADRLVLQALSFKVGAGESISIIGPSGAGKSTLLHLLPRFFDPVGGAVRLDGADLRELRLQDLRRQVSLVMQEPILLAATIAENIAYGKPGASMDEIKTAARAAQADGFIERLAKDYHTVVGEGATRLSVGEKQRLNLARAFLKDAPVLVLDEPTSALDAESERLVVASLEQLMRGRTTFIVAHRFSTIGRVDRILVLERGQISEMGTPAELLRQDGYFSRLSGKLLPEHPRECV